MDNVRLVNAFLELKFDKFEKNDIKFNQEFESLSKDSVDPINEWVRRQKANGNADETDKILLDLIVQLHKKVDILMQKIDNKEDNRYIDLCGDSDIISIGYEYFQISDDKFEIDQKYYGRILLPVFPKRMVPVIFTANTTNMASITKMSFGDEKDWDSYVSQRERELIREMKGAL